eukprot:gene18067-23714_t
MKFRKV